MDRVEYFFAIMALTGFALIFRAGLWSLWVLAQLTEARALWRRLLRLRVEPRLRPEALPLLPRARPRRACG